MAEETALDPKSHAYVPASILDSDECAECGLSINLHSFTTITQTMTREEYRQMYQPSDQPKKLHEVERFAIDSSSIKSVGYDESEGVLIVEFKNGHLYAYTMEPHQFEAFCRAESKGTYYAKEIKGKLAGTKLTGACQQCQAAPQVIGETCACGGKVVEQMSKREAARYER